MLFPRAKLADDLRFLASRNVLIGTSSWKYRGWCGMIYDEARYIYRGRFAERRFQQGCLSEYAEVFPTVCVDAAYYTFPERARMEELSSQTPKGFLFAFKVTDEITIKKFTNLPRFGPRAGKPNENYLNSDLFIASFLEPCTAMKDKIGLLMFEFSKFHGSDYFRGREFVEDLDAFLGKLPPGWPYGIEIRNRNFLHPDYFTMLRKHRVTHIYNSWTAMPPVSEQLQIPESDTNPELTAARFLLKPGRSYEQAVDLFSPYDAMRDASPDARKAGAALIKSGVQQPSRKTLIYVNNRLEGSAPLTILGMIDEAMNLESA